MSDKIKSKPASQEYRDNYERIFGKKEEIGPLQAMVRDAFSFLNNHSNATSQTETTK